MHVLLPTCGSTSASTVGNMARMARRLPPCSVLSAVLNAQRRHVAGQSAARQALPRRPAAPLPLHHRHRQRGPPHAPLARRAHQAAAAAGVDGRDTLYIDGRNTADLRVLIDHLKETAVIGMDTEFTGFPLYTPKVELMQFSTGSFLAVSAQPPSCSAGGARAVRGRGPFLGDQRVVAGSGGMVWWHQPASVGRQRRRWLCVLWVLVECQFRPSTLPASFAPSPSPLPLASLPHCTLRPPPSALRPPPSALHPPPSTLHGIRMRVRGVQCVDCVAFTADDVRELVAALEGKEVIAHGCEQDITILQGLGLKNIKLFDTQIAAVRACGRGCPAILTSLCPGGGGARRSTIWGAWWCALPYQPLPALCQPFASLCQPLPAFAKYKWCRGPDQVSG